MRNFSSNAKATTAAYLRRQMNDGFAKLAREHSYRARSAFKLIEMDDRFRFLKPGKVVVDVGAAPGSWSQVVANRLCLSQESTSYLLSIDLQNFLPIPGVDMLIESDIRNHETHKKIKERLNKRHVNLLLSDMAPNPTGDNNTDHLRLIDLCRLLLNMTYSPDPIFPLSDDAVFICKIWNGAETQNFLKDLNKSFKKVRLFKPTACRESSAELYVIGMK